MLTIPLALVAWSEMSVITVYASEIFPFINPPTIRAKTKTRKLLDTAHNA